MAKRADDDVMAEALTFIDSTAGRRCPVCGNEKIASVLDILIKAMLIRKRQLSYARIMVYIKQKVGCSPARETLTRHLREHEKRWPEVEAFGAQIK